MKKYTLFFVMSILVFGSCSVTDRAMQTPNYHIEFYKSDFEYSPQVTAEATMVRVLGIDWSRLFNWNSATISNSNEFSSPNLDVSVGTTVLVDPIVGVVSAIIPVLGDQVKGGVRSYALYNLMAENPGYDVVVYPQYEVKKYIVPIFYSKRTAKVTARLAKIK
ncbi:MAG: hypothetical protein RBT19_07440 [Tenuifilaceae bacterium]|jgi:hypothetical protein|nr:hypothetical protein [Tenuifilaceae bacterium]